MKKVKNESVDVHNSEEMIALGIHPRFAEPRDESVWTKTPKEKKILKKLRNKRYHFGPGFNDYKCFPLRTKLIIQIKKSEDFVTIDKKHNLVHFKTTFSCICNQNEIKRILNIFGKDNVIKYYWNGKTYRPSELPYRGW